MPRIIQEIKIICIILLLIVLYIFNVHYVKFKFSKSKLMQALLVYFIYAIFSAFVGVIYNNLGVVDFIRINILYFVLFCALLPCVYIKNIKQVIIFSLFLSMSHIIIFNLLLVFVQSTVLLSLIKRMDATPFFQFHDGYLHIISTNCSMLIFLFPLFLTLYCNRYKILFVNSKFFLLTLILAMIVGILTGRRIIWIIIILSLFLQLFRMHKKTFVISYITITALLLASLGIFSYEGLSNRFLEAFSSASVKYQQMIALWDGFLQYPFIGAGAGASVADVVRDPQHPWIYELSYNLVLYNSGIIGTSLYFLHLLLLLHYLKLSTKRKPINSNVNRGMYYALLMCIIANASNPYIFSSFDFLWMLYIPMLYIYIEDNSC